MTTFLARQQHLVVFVSYRDDTTGKRSSLIQLSGEVGELFFWLLSGLMSLLRRAIAVRVGLMVMWAWRDVEPVWALLVAHWRALPVTLWGPGRGDDAVMVALAICEPIWRTIRWAVEEMMR